MKTEILSSGSKETFQYTMSDLGVSSGSVSVSAGVAPVKEPEKRPLKRADLDQNSSEMDGEARRGLFPFAG